MTRKTLIITTDDLSGDEGAGTVRFALDGENYEIDLTPANAAGLRETLAPFVLKARRAAPGNVSKRPNRAAHAVESAEVRDWAKANGIDLAPRGRIPAGILARYEGERAALRAAQRAGNGSAAPAPGTATATPDGAAERSGGTAPEPGTAGSQGAGKRSGGTAPDHATPDGEGAAEPAPAIGSNPAIRQWAASTGREVNARGRIPEDVRASYWATMRPESDGGAS